MRRGADSITCRRTGGAQVRCPAGRDRRVGVPPVWKHVWTASDHRAHIPATGVDAAGHPWYLCQLRWRELRDDEKCKRSLAFAQSPPPPCAFARPGITAVVPRQVGRRVGPASVQRLAGSCFDSMAHTPCYGSAFSLPRSQLECHRLVCTGKGCCVGPPARQRCAGLADGWSEQALTKSAPKMSTAGNGKSMQALLPFKALDQLET